MTPFVIANRTPLKIIIIPRVVINEGMRVRKVIIPLTKPMRLANIRVITKAKGEGKPVFASNPKMNADAA
ncbi:MAG: hypothetical protein DDT18_01764 [Actinobacteria bacterium]|nr:hypothetical protein [Actinomycetota bacterium]